MEATLYDLPMVFENKKTHQIGAYISAETESIYDMKYFHIVDTNGYIIHPDSMDTKTWNKYRKFYERYRLGRLIFKRA